MIDLEIPESDCGCSLPPGLYGSCGWHVYRHTAASCDRRGVHRAYAGTVVAVERCPAAVRALQADIDRRRSEAPQGAARRPAA